MHDVAGPAASGDAHQAGECSAGTSEQGPERVAFTEDLDRVLSQDQRLDTRRGAVDDQEMVAQLDQQLNTLRAEDAGVGQALSTEQPAGSSFNARLEELEGLLATEAADPPRTELAPRSRGNTPTPRLT